VGESKIDRCQTDGSDPMFIVRQNLPKKSEVFCQSRRSPGFYLVF